MENKYSNMNTKDLQAYADDLCGDIRDIKSGKKFMQKEEIVKERLSAVLRELRYRGIYITIND